MQRALCWSVILLTGTFGPRPAAFAQAASIPLSLEITASRTEVAVGETAQLVVKLKSYTIKQRLAIIAEANIGNFEEQS